jgi:TRAP-type mannitol/chloroaromatic compound transport system permease large subunit
MRQDKTFQRTQSQPTLGVAPPGVTTADIWKAAIPFIGLQLVGLGLCMAVPEIVLFLPRLIYGEP